MDTYDIYFFDLDGTLATSKQPMAPDMVDVFTHLAQQQKVAIITGGTAEQIHQQVVEKLPPSVWTNMYLLPTSGSVLFEYNMSEWQQVYAHEFTAEDVETITRAFAHALEQSGVELPQQTFGEQIENRGSQITFSALGQDAPYDKKAVWDPDHKKREKIVAVLREHLPGYRIGIGGTTSIDVVKSGVDKAYGIQKLTEHLGTIPGQCVYVGDALFEGGNDSAARETGIVTRATPDPAHTVDIIKGFLRENS